MIKYLKMDSLIQNLISFLLSPQFEGWLLVLRIVFIIISLLFLLFIIFSLFSTQWLKELIVQDWVEFFTFRPYGIRRIEKIWNRIMARLESGLESEYKLAVIEADSLLDDILKRMGYLGQTLGERLDRLTAASLPNIEEIRVSHQTRNNIIHDPDYRLSLDEARKTLEVYEQALRDLQAF